MNFDLLLNTLSKDQLLGLKQKIEIKLSTLEASYAPSKSEEAPDQDEQQVYRAIQKLVTARGERSIPWTVFRGGQDHRTLAKRVPWLKKFIQDYLKPETRIELDWCYQLVIGMVVGFLEHSSVPVSTRTVINNLDRTPALVDKAFPGYLQANILSALLVQLRK